MPVKKILLITLLFVFISHAFLNADTLYLKNGRSLQGLIKNEDAKYIELEVCGGRTVFKKSEIERVNRVSSEEADEIRNRWEREKIEMWGKISKQRQEEEQKPPRIQFSKDKQNIEIRVTLNKKVDATLILDTGAQLVMLRKKIAQNLGIDLDKIKTDAKVTLADGRQVKAKYITLESIKVEGVEANNVEATVLLDEVGGDDLSDGLLGMSFLKRFNFKIDHKDKKLILEKL